MSVATVLVLSLLIGGVARLVQVASNRHRSAEA